MNGRCERELDVLHAAAHDAWSEGLRGHVASCADCAAAVVVAPWMEQFAAVDDRAHVLPDPAVVWLKAQLLRTSTAVDRAARPMTNLQRAAYFIVAAAWAAVLTWKWSALQQWMLSMTPSGYLGANAAASVTLSVSFFVTIFVIASATVMLAVHTILAEE